MREEQRVVARIKDLLESGGEMDLTALAGLAEQYARVCDRANERLRQCERYLGSGMRTEAIHLAETPPPLLEVAAILDFHGVEAWRKICQGNERTPVPSLIAAEVVSWLNQAYVQENSLTEVLSEYKRVTLGGGALPQRIRLLRRLVKLDADSASHWQEDLRGFEQARFGQLAEDVDRATRADDLQALESLHREVNSPNWQTKPDRRLVTEVERQLQRVRVQVAQANGKEIAQEAWEAFGALDYALTASALQQWQALIEEGFFLPPPDLAASIGEVQEWFDIEQKKRTEEQEFKGALSALAGALDKGLSRAELQRHLFAVTKHDREIPQALLRRTQLAIEDAQMAEKRARNLIIGAASALVLVVAVVTLLLVRSGILQRRRNEWGLRIEQAVEQLDYQGAEKLLSDLDKQSPRIAREPTFKEWERRIKSGKENVISGRAYFDDIFEKLDNIRKGGFEEPYEALLREAEELVSALTAEQRLQLEEWKLDKDTRSRKLQKERDDQFKALIASAEEGFKSLSAFDPKTQASEYAAALVRIGKDLRAAQRMPDVSDTVKMLLPSLRAELLRYEEEHGETTERVALRERLLDGIQQALPDLNEYDRLLRDFTTTFPNDAETARFEKIIEHCALGKDLGRRTPSPHVDGETKAWVEEFLKAPENQQSVWRDSVEWLSAQVGVASRAQEVLQSMNMLRQNVRFYGLHYLDEDEIDETTETHLRYYFVERPEPAVEEVRGGKGRFRYWVEVFDGSDEQEKQVVKLNAPIPTDTLAPHCKWFRRVFRKIREVSPGDCEVVLLESIEELRTDQESDPIVRAILMLEFLEYAKKLRSDKTAEIDRLIERLGMENTNVAWLDPKPDLATTQAREDIERLLTEEMGGMPPLGLGAWIASRIHSEALSRNVRCVGQVKLDGGELHMDLGNLIVPEVWIVTTARGSVPAVHIAAVADAERTLEIQPGVAEYLFPGQPLFAPAGRERTSEILKSIREGIPAGEERVIEQVLWPSCWPVNGRNLRTEGKGRSDGD